MKIWGSKQILCKLANQNRSALFIRKTSLVALALLVGHVAWSNQEINVAEMLAEIEALPATTSRTSNANLQKQFTTYLKTCKAAETKSLISALLVRLPDLFQSTSPHNVKRQFLFSLALTCLASRPSDDNHYRILLLYHLKGISQSEKTKIIDVLLKKTFSNQKANVATFVDYLSGNIQPDDTIYRVIEAIGKLKATEAIRAVANYVLKYHSSLDPNCSAAASRTLAMLVYELDRRCPDLFPRDPPRF